jgi:hypothetical protein
LDKKRDRKHRNRPIASVAQILSQVTENLAIDQKVHELALLALWPQVVEDSLRDRTKAVRIVQEAGRHILWVRVKDAVTAGELSFQTETIREKLNQYSPQTGLSLHGIRLKIGSL